MWNNIKNTMPELNKYVLVHTPFCKYQCSVAFWNGVEWRSADNKENIWNINYWQELPNINDL